MLLRLISFVFAATLAAFTYAQTIADLSPCFQSCIQQALSASGCDATDLNCICKNATFLSVVSPCELTNCTNADIVTCTPITAKICEAVGGIASVDTTVNPSYVSSVVASLSSAGMPMATNGSSGSVTPGSPTPTVLPYTGAAWRMDFGAWSTTNITVIVVGTVLLFGWR